MKAEINKYDFMKKIITNLCGIVFIIDMATQKYIWGNNRYKDILGYNDNEIITNTLEFADKYFHPDDKYIAQDRLNFFKNNGNEEWSGVYRIRHQKGHWLWLFSRVTVFARDDKGNPTQLLGEVLHFFDNIKTVKKLMALLKNKTKINNIEIIRKLTNREIEIISHISIGENYKEIAKKLGISPETVNKHRKNILLKLNLNNVASLTTFAHKNGLI